MPKQMNEAMSAFDEIEKRIKPEHTFFVDFGLDFAKQVRYVLSTHPTIKTQRDLAKAMNKRESEISKMLTGLHNLTLDSMSKMCAVLEFELIMTDLRAKAKYNSGLVVIDTPQTIHVTITTIIFEIRPFNEDYYRPTFVVNEYFNASPISVLSKELMLS